MKIVKFGAMWCPACLIMNKRIDQLVKKYDIELIEYDYDYDEDKIEEYNIGEILPELIIYMDNIESKRLIGEISIKKLEKEISDLL